MLGEMIELLQQSADNPPTELKGCPDSFLDELERVPNKTLNKTDECPICVNPFLEGQLTVKYRKIRKIADFVHTRSISACSAASMPQRPPF